MARQAVASLTERETEVLACLGEGLSNAQIAARLYLSEATVKGYVSRMLDKLGLANRTQPGCSRTTPAWSAARSRCPGRARSSG
jgi:DNA-binding NarL/FixJ family response regulator